MEISLKDFNKCCRCCLISVETLKPLFGGSLNEMLATLMNFQVKHNDGYPQQICPRCILKLSTAHTFYLTVTRSQTILENLLKGSAPEGNSVESSMLDKSEQNRESHTFEEEIQTAEKVPYNAPINRLGTQCVESGSEASSDNEGYHCSQCEHTAKDPDQLKTHLRTHLVSDTPKGDSAARRCIYLCNYCGARFRWRTSLSKHVRCHRGLAHRCPHCPKQFAEASSLKIHLITHSVDNPKPFHCTKCDRSFTQQSSLKKHEGRHTARQKLPCQHCEKSFLHKSSLQRHLESAHVPEECPLCNKLFSGKKFLDAHMRSHKKDEMPKSKKEKPPDGAVAESINIQSVTVEFLCLKCGNKFQSRESLEVHVCSKTSAKYYLKLA